MASRFVTNGRFRAALRNLPEAARREIAQSLEQVARRMQVDAVVRAPMRTGRLRRALAAKAAIGKRRKGLEVTFGLRTRGLQKRAFYAPFVEHGTRAYEAGSHRLRGVNRQNEAKYRRMNRRVPARPARPFFRPAVEANIPLWRREMRSALKRALARARRG